MVASPYRPLDKSKHEVRLIELQPNENESQPLVCQLITRSLIKDEGWNLLFESLSYAWGDNGQLVPLQVNGCTLMIRSNLDHALRAIRQKDKSSTLWVDAISINQNDVSERNHQVQLMRSIYTGASRVNIWLGPDFTGAQAAFETLKDLANGISLKTSLGSSAMSFGPKLLLSLRRIFEHGWWSRLWIIQEALLAREAIVRCGTHNIKFSTIMSAFELLWNEYITSGQVLRAICGAEEIEGFIRTLEATVRRLHIVRGFVFFYDSSGKRQFRNSPSALPYLLHSCAWSQVTDLRDKIYGTLGLFSNTFLEPDYSISVKDVYTRSTYAIMKEMRNLTLMSQAICQRQNILELPSFVPDYSQPSVLTAPFLVFYNLYNAAKDTKFHIDLIQNSKLSVFLQEVDSVVEVGLVLDHQGCTKSSQLRKLIRPILISWKEMYQNRHPKTRSLSNNADISVDPSFKPSHLQSNKRKRETFEMPCQSQWGPMYRDSDYKTPVAETSKLVLQQRQLQVQLQLHHQQQNEQILQQRLQQQRLQQLQPQQSQQHLQQTRDLIFPMQSTTAPLLRDGDYKLSRSMTAPVRNTSSQGVPQSYSAPMFHRSDSMTATPSSSTKLAPSLTVAETKQAAAVRTTTTANSHRSYDSFSHTYIDKPSIATPSNPNPDPESTLKSKHLLHPPDDFWRILSMDVIDCPVAQTHRRCLDIDYPRFNEWLIWVLHDDGLSAQNIPQLHWHLITVLQEKRLVKTASGLFGLVSRHVRIGDKVCILAGESYPYILRSVEDEGVASGYSSICPAFVEGLMDGEKADVGNFKQAYIV
ncbi:Hypothetical protein R9X50_00230400 [Acrodontium crateriforme]|uniref:Heterokaryon incompatibility domain-containing protein n=1 Tax=Acrodontium crateriforme TaxID=150365 RepID=A0AAQ3R8U9_9PEZI|nr:Hypothetical protein R9X50_00230400 [Acrodontium crateriforme]